MCEDGGRWYLEAYCLLRIEERTFRLDRILEMRLDGDPFAGLGGD